MKVESVQNTSQKSTLCSKHVPVHDMGVLSRFVPQGCWLRLIGFPKLLSALLLLFPGNIFQCSNPFSIFRCLFSRQNGLKKHEEHQVLTASLAPSKLVIYIYIFFILTGRGTGPTNPLGSDVRSHQHSRKKALLTIDFLIWILHYLMEPAAKRHSPGMGIDPSWGKEQIT